MSKKVILWDFDGVLLDSFELDFKICKLFTDMKTYEQHYDIFTGNVHTYTEANKWLTHVDGKTFDEHVNDYIFDCPLFDQVKELILDLHSRGVQQAIISSAPEPRIEKILQTHKLRHAFTDLFGSNIEKLKTKKFDMFLKKYELHSSQALFITDTLGDLREAAQVDVPSIAVSWGYHPNEYLARGTSLQIVDTPIELISALDKYL